MRQKETPLLQTSRGHSFYSRDPSQPNVRATRHSIALHVRDVARAYATCRDTVELVRVLEAPCLCASLERQTATASSGESKRVCHCTFGAQSMARNAMQRSMHLDWSGWSNSGSGITYRSFPQPRTVLAVRDRSLAPVHNFCCFQVIRRR